MSERRSPTEERLTPPKCLNYSSASPTSSGYLGRPSPQLASGRTRELRRRAATAARRARRRLVRREAG